MHAEDRKRTLVANVTAADVDLLAAHNDEALALEQLLSHGGSKAAEQMAARVNNDPLRES